MQIIEIDRPPHATIAHVSPTLSADRATITERIAADRLRIAVAAVRAAGLVGEAAMLETCSPSSPAWCDLAAVTEYCRDETQALRTMLADGRDEPRYAAANVALAALGALWAVS